LSEGLFGSEPYHVLLATTGLALLLAYGLPRAVFARPPSSSWLLMVCGLVAFAWIPGMPDALDPVSAPLFWELVSELVVIVVLFATGLRIDEVRGPGLWSPTIRLLSITMPLTIAAVALLGWSLAGMTVAGAVLVGAALAPTDPVLAGDVQIGPPLEGGEHPVRFALTTEAGLNDGLAFPFVHLGLLIATLGHDPALWLDGWLVRDLVYRIAAGVLGGAAMGFALGQVLFRSADGLAEKAPGILALAGVLLTYGAVELIEGYGFIAAFVAGLVCRRMEKNHAFHRRLHAFSETLEEALTAILLVLLGGALPALWPELDWRISLIGLALLLVIRPIAGWAALWGTPLGGRERAVTAFYGVRGIGSVYYLSYASGRIEFVDASQIWALVAYTVFASTLIHGATARLVVDRVVGTRTKQR
jgi:NhaP-type Na+/H+ or K+/H+ antiporter